MLAHLHGQPFAGGEGVGDFPEGGLDRGFVVGDGHLLACFGQFQVGAGAAAVEQGHPQHRRETPTAAAAAEQAIQLGAGGAAEAGQRDVGQKRRAGGMDVGLTRGEASFGGADVGSAGEQFGRQARRQCGLEPLTGQRRGRHWRRQGVAHELLQQGVVLGALAFEGGEFAAGGEQQALDLTNFEVGTAADFGTAPHDAEGFLAGGERPLGQHDAFVQLAGQQVGVGNLGDQSQFECPPGFVAGQELGQCGVVEAAYPAPEIDFVGDEVGPDRVLPADLVPTGDRQVGRRARAHSVDPEAEAGAVAGLLDVVERADFADAGDGKLEIAVVGQRGVDQRAQVRVGKECSPLGSGRDRRFLSGTGVMGRNDRFRRMAGRRRRTAGEPDNHAPQDTSTDRDEFHDDSLPLGGR